MAIRFERVLGQLKDHGLLLQTDPRLPNVCALVAGTPVRGSWWAHPRSHDIFQVNCALAEHPDVLITKLVSAKITYVDRDLWSAVVTIGRARDAWQLKNLSGAARELLHAVDRAPVQTDRTVAKPASELEKLLLVYSQQSHTEGGAHARRLESWDEWLSRRSFVPADLKPGTPRHTLDKIIESLNRRFKASGRLPWHS